MYKVHYAVWLCLVVIFPSYSRCQSFVFNDGDRIVFIGSSNAMHGDCYHYINFFYSTRYPKKNLHFFNGGISGDQTDGMLKRLDSDVLNNQPTWCIMAIEENDLQPSLYKVGNPINDSIKALESKAFNHWKSNTELIAKTLLKHNVKVILQTPAIYDQTLEAPAWNAFGINDTLKKCSDYMKQLGKKYNLPVVDCWTPLNRINQEIQQNTPKASIVGADRMHLGNQGHFVIACTFLESQHVQPFISQFEIDFRSAKAQQQKNCIINSIKRSNENISFQYLSGSLPFASPEGVNADSLMHFTKDLNADRIKIRQLPKGKYIFSIDTVDIGLFTDAELENGINLSYYKNSPQYQQSLKVLGLFEQYWSNERVLRALKYVEYQHQKDLGTSTNVKQFNEQLPDVMRKYKEANDVNYDFFYEMFRKYIANKPHETEYYKKAENLLQQIAAASRPVKHLYSIRKFNSTF